VTRAFLLIVAMLTLGGCFQEPVMSLDPPVSVPFVTVEQGTSSGIRDARFLVVRTEKAWKDLWAAHAAAVTPPPAPPAIDFAQEMVVAVFSGERPTGGSRVQIQGVETQSRQNVIIVTYQQSDAPSGAMTTQVLTQPFHMVKAKKSEGLPTFMRRPGAS